MPRAVSSLPRSLLLTVIAAAVLIVAGISGSNAAQPAKRLFGAKSCRPFSILLPTGFTRKAVWPVVSPCRMTDPTGR